MSPEPNATDDAVALHAANAAVALSAALAKAQAEFSGVGKSGENKYDKYRYAMLEDFVQVAKPILAKYGFSVVTSVEEVIPVADRETKGGTVEHVVRVKISLRLLHESGAMVETFSFGEGQDRADKAIYKAITGARKYGLASLLGLATTDDPEADETVGRDGAPKPPAAPPAPRPVPAPTVPAPAPVAPPTVTIPVPPPIISVTASASSGVTTSEVPAPAAPQQPADPAAKDAALTQDSGPCADCGIALIPAMQKYIVNVRKQGKKVRWSHQSIPGLDKFKDENGRCNHPDILKLAGQVAAK